MIDWLVPHIQKIEELKTANQYDAAKSLVKDLLLKYTDDYRLYEEMADIHLFLGDLIQAGQAIKIAQELNYESATGMYLSGYIKVSAGDFKGGIELLEQANKLFQNNPEILRHLGWAYTVTGNVDRGIFLLKRALNLAPEDTLIMEDLGIALLSELSDPFEGEELLRKAGKEHRITEIRALMHI